ncbi:MAG: PAS domain S-box protein [Thermodesulfobacteriota bacterium]
MAPFHSLLKRQLRRCFGDGFSVPEAWQAFVDSVNHAYEESDQDREMLERSLELSSQELLQANTELRALLKAIPDLVFRLDRDGTILNYEAGDPAHFYLRPEELVGRQIQDVPVQHVGDQFRAAIERVRETKSGVSMEYWMMLHDLDHCYEARLLPLLDNQIIVIIREVTEHKRAEQALLESRQRYRDLYEESERTGAFHRKLLDASPDAVVVYDIDGKPVYLSPAFTRLFGWTLDEVRGRTIDFVPAENWPETRVLIDKVLRGEDFSDAETRRLTKTGEIIDVSVSGAVFFDLEGRPAGSVIHLRDITERKRLEEQLRQAAKMEAIGRLAGGVAHDFNNLLTVMLGYSKMLVQQLPKESPYYSKLVQVGNSAERAAALTRQLLAFSRKQVLEVRVLDLNAGISAIEDMLRRLIGEDIELTTVFSPNLGKIEADPVQIEQILVNLAANARDAMPSGGTLTIETNNVMLDEEYARTHSDVQSGSYVMLAVSDTGEGMNPETVSRVFEPFFSTKARGKGTGLGLSTVYGIAKQHNGHIYVYSEPGLGTTFKVYFPRIDQPAETLAGASSQYPEGVGKETVLIVEDEEVVREFAADALGMLGYCVLKACDPDEAMRVARLHESVIDLMLTDVVLPQMDGRSLFVLLSQTRPAMKVLYMSGYTDNAIVRRGVLDKAVHFLQKPFVMETLARKVREALGD